MYVIYEQHMFRFYIRALSRNTSSSVFVCVCVPQDECMLLASAMQQPAKFNKRKNEHILTNEIYKLIRWCLS